MLWVDLADDVLALSRIAQDLDVPIAEDGAAGHVAAQRLAQQRIARALARLVALHLGSVRGHGEQELVGGRVQDALAVLHVVEHANAGDDDLLQQIRRLDLLATETVDVAHDEHLEWRAWLQARHQGHEPGPPLELGAADPVVRKDVPGQDGPALLQGVGPRALDLAGDGLLLVGHPVLVRRLPRVDRGDHLAVVSLTASPEEVGEAHPEGASEPFEHRERRAAVARLEPRDRVPGDAGPVGERLLGPAALEAAPLEGLSPPGGHTL